MMDHYHQITPLKAYHPLLRKDTLPFIIIYTTLILMDQLPVLVLHSYYEHIIIKWNRILFFPLSLFLHLSLFVWTRWSVRVETWVGYKRCHDVIITTGVVVDDDDDDGNNNDDDDQNIICHSYSSWTHCLVVPPTTNHTMNINNNNNDNTSMTDKSQNKKMKHNVITAGSVGRMEIVPVQLKRVQNNYFKYDENDDDDDDNNNNMKKNMKKKTNNESWVAIISYEEMIFRCFITNGHTASQDVEMDGIWKTCHHHNFHDISYQGDTTKTSSSMNNDTTTHTTKTQSLLSSSTSNHPSSIFHRLHYPIDLPLSFYIHQWKGHPSKQSIHQTYSVYSNNNLKINLPPFMNLLSQQLLAPFFLFQLFCVLLWCLDEYWYYALFTLFTLILFECTVAHTRLRNLLRLRETLRMPFTVWAYRCKKWKLVTTDELIVGDVISLSSSSTSYQQQQKQQYHHDNHHGTHIPADLLLIKGSAVVNEAMLTGESVPQMKESIDLVASAMEGGGGSNSTESSTLKLDIDDSSYKRCILFGGTVLVNHSSQSITDSDSSDDGGVNGKNVSSSSMSSTNNDIPSPPDHGCITMVLRTGFDTQQGSLLRTMVHTSTKAQSDGVNTKDTFLFIIILLLCAVFSSLIVLKHGWNDPTRNRFKLILHIIIIITSVVPPELPMELSLAVTSSLADLIKRCSVYCTEPFRIPLAGMVDTCCFDKTGTLTSDEMVLRGVRLVFQGADGILTLSDSLVSPSLEISNEEEVEESKRKESIPPDVLRVMVGCQSLASLSGYGNKSASVTENLIGDPLEKAVLEGCGWSLLSNTMVGPPASLLSSNKSLGMIEIKHRFAFTSKLKRMTVIAADVRDKKYWALTKGAPETLKTFFDPSSIPSSYDSVSRYHMSLGQRVLAMGYKELSGKATASAWKKLGREAIEDMLIFAGFLVLDCPLKPDTRKVIKELRSSGHDVVMITGDAVLTAAEVARQVGIISNATKADTYELREMERYDSHGTAKFAFVPIKSSIDIDSAEEKEIAYSPSNLKVVKNMLNASKIAAICVSGDVLTKLAMDAVQRKARNDNVQRNVNIDVKSVLLHPDAQVTLQNLVPLVSVFARHAPRQKEAVVAAFNGAGRYTLMCGDGTNDVGALKMSHVGISIISVPEVEAKQRKALNGLAKIRDEEKRASVTKTKGAPLKKDKEKKKKKSRKKAWDEHLKELAAAEDELNHVSLGDASVASPFTSRVTSIKCTKDVLQRGRCTLVTMLQIYKILGVNCLVNALVLSSLHLAGAKQGDTQLTAVGFVVAGLFFFVTKGHPLSKLSKTRPPASVLSIQAIVSIAVQFAIHFVFIMAVTSMSRGYLDSKYDPSLVPDGAFNPNTLNTATFLITVEATVTTFAVNYRGRPFMEDLHENKLMMRGLQFCFGTLFICALEVFPPINDLLQLASLPSSTDVMVYEGATILTSIHLQLLRKFIDAIGFKVTLSLFMAADAIVTYFAEKMIIRLFQ